MGNHRNKKKNKNVNKNRNKEVNKEVNKKVNNNGNKDVSNKASKNVNNHANEDVSKEVSKNINNNASNHVNNYANSCVNMCDNQGNGERKYWDNNKGAAACPSIPLWKDKKRYFGMPISFTTYSIADGRLYIERGLLCTFYDEVMLFRIFDVRMVQTLWQKFFGVGTVVVYTSDASSNKKAVRLVNIQEPLKIRDLISHSVEMEREVKGIQSAEFLGPAM